MELVNYILFSHVSPALSEKIGDRGTYIQRLRPRGSDIRICDSAGEAGEERPPSVDEECKPPDGDFVFLVHECRDVLGVLEVDGIARKRFQLVVPAVHCEADCADCAVIPL